MKIELEWDDDAIEHIARHQVRPHEVEETVYDARSEIRRLKQKRYMVYGQTASGRYLKLVIEALNTGRFYPVTAYEMDDSDRRSFRRRSGGRA